MTEGCTPTTVALHDLVFLDEGEQVVVGRRDVDTYGVFPPDGAALLRVLRDGRPVCDAARWYEQTYGERVDMEAFLAALAELGLVRDGGHVMRGEQVDDRVPWQRLGRLVFSPVAFVVYGLAITAAVVVSLSEPSLRPSPRHIVFCGSLVIVELTVVLGQGMLALVHEGFHVLAGRRLGVRTRIRISRRFYYVVYETVLDGLVSVPRSMRYLPILAGLIADLLCLSLLILLARVTRGAGAEPALVARIGLALAVTTLPRIAWQFYFYLETDVYHLISTALGCNDLQRTARHVARLKLQRLLRKRPAEISESSFDPRDLRVARWYTPVMVAGYLLSAVTIALLVVPLAWQFASHLVAAFWGSRSDAAHEWDGAVVLAFTTIQLLLALAIAIRDRRKHSSEGRIP